MIALNLLLLLFAFVCFVCATIGVTSRVNLVALGLACWVASTFIGVYVR